MKLGQAFSPVPIAQAIKCDEDLARHESVVERRFACQPVTAHQAGAFDAVNLLSPYFIPS